MTPSNYIRKASEYIKCKTNIKNHEKNLMLVLNQNDVKNSTEEEIRVMQRAFSKRKLKQL
jgi:hypothetical protein